MLNRRKIMSGNKLNRPKEIELREVLYSFTRAFLILSQLVGIVDTI